MARRCDVALARAHPNLLNDDERLISVFGASPEPTSVSIAARLIGLNPAENPPATTIADVVSRRTRFAAVTDQRVILLAGRARFGGTRPGDVVADVAVDQVDRIEVVAAGDAVILHFVDGSSALLTADDPTELRGLTP